MNKALDSGGRLLVWGGAAVAAIGAAFLAIGAWANLSQQVVIVIAKSLPFVVGAGMIALGSVIGRYARRRSSQPWRDEVAEPRQPVLKGPEMPTLATAASETVVLSDARADVEKTRPLR